MGGVVAAAERTWPMAGRAEELGFVRSALCGRGGVVLAGAAGVGKTRLAREAVAAASTAAEAMGALLVAADAAAQYRRAGDRRSALSCAARAQDLARLCGGAATPALRALAAVAPLTGRERETVALAAAGLSNQDIAARPVVSVHTVEGHLYRAFAKLGVAELASGWPAPRGTRPRFSTERSAT